MKSFYFFAILIIVFVITGCSSGSNRNPVYPGGDNGTNIDKPSGNPAYPPMETYDPTVSDALKNGETTVDGSDLWFAGKFTLDPATNEIEIVEDREMAFNFNITGFLMHGACTGGCVRYKIVGINGTVFEIQVTLENPTKLQGYDVRCIFTNLYGKKVVNPDGYSDLYDPSGGPIFNPFIAFAMDDPIRGFPTGPGGTDTQTLFLDFPAGSNPSVGFVITASFPANTQEPYTMFNFVQLGELTYAGGLSNVGVEVDDWQLNIEGVLVDLRLFTGSISYLAADPERPGRYEVQFSNILHAYPGLYPTVFRADSPNPQNAHMYNIYNILVSGEINEPPTCDLDASSETIRSGQSISLFPGPGTGDPNGDNIVLYEYDFNYDGTTFDVDASNTTGNPVITPPVIIGSTPVTVTCAMRITDDGVPPMSSTCTIAITINPNQGPVCEVVAVPPQVDSGSSVQLKPGTSCKDPDGIIALYEYDFSYDSVTFNMEASNTTGIPVTSPILTNPGSSPITIKMAMRITDDGMPVKQSLCTVDVVVNPVTSSVNPFRIPQTIVTPDPATTIASIDRSEMKANVAGHGNNIYVAYHGTVNEVDNLYIQRSGNGGVTFGQPVNINHPMNCSTKEFNEMVVIDCLANGDCVIATAAFPGENGQCAEGGRIMARFLRATPQGSNSVTLTNWIDLNRDGQIFAHVGDDSVQSIDIAAHPTDPNICFVSLVDLDGGDDPDDLSFWRVTDVLTTPTPTLEQTVAGAPGNTSGDCGIDKITIDACVDYNGNLHTVWVATDMDKVFYAFSDGVTLAYKPFTQVNLDTETTARNPKVHVDSSNNPVVVYSAVSIAGDGWGSGIGLRKGTGFPPMFVGDTLLVNRETLWDQKNPDIRINRTTGEIWVVFDSYRDVGPASFSQILFEKFDAGMHRFNFTPNYFVNTDDATNSHTDIDSHLNLDRNTGTVYVIWKEETGPNSPNIAFNRTN